MPYSPNIVPFNWRGLRNYGVGAIGDMGCHIIEPIFNAINLPLPRKLKATCDKSSINDYTWASSNQIDFEFETPYARDGIMKMRWYDGGRMPDSIKDVDMET
jgi:predicted dehydrogenase